MTLIYRNKLIQFILGTGIFMLLFLAKTGSASAVCGVNSGDMTSLAGAIIVPVWYDDSNQKRLIPDVSTDVKIKFTTRDETIGTRNYPYLNANKIVQVNSSGSENGNKVSSAQFDVVPGCALGKSAVLGYANDSSPKTYSPYVGSNRWVLDCDESYWGNGNGQRFDVTGVGTPPGARPGGTWETIIIRADNGFTVVREVRYTQPSVNLDFYSNLIKVLDNGDSDTNVANRPYMPNGNVAGVGYGNMDHFIGNGIYRTPDTPIGGDNTDRTSSLFADNILTTYATEIGAPDRIRIDGVDWNKTGYKQCNNEDAGQCRVSARSDWRTDWGGSESSVRYAANGFTAGTTHNIYWFYEMASTPPPTCALNANPTTINQGSSSTLSWSTTNNPTSLVITPGLPVGTPVTGGNTTVSPGSTTTYKGFLNGNSTSGTPDCQVTINVNIPLPTCALNANPTTINQGSSSTLSWSTTNNPSTLTVRDQYGNGLSVNTPVSGGSTSVSPPSNITYYGYLNGSATASCQATITVIPLPSCTLTITGINTLGVSTTVNSNNGLNLRNDQNSIQLSWTSANASSLTFYVGASPNTSDTLSGLPRTYNLNNHSTIIAARVTNSTGQQTTCTVTVDIDSDQPYLKAFGNDVSVGSAFIGVNSNCSINNNARINAYVDDTLSRGAGTQFAAHAPSTIKGFLSAVTRRGSAFQPNSANGLTFGNSANGTDKINPTSSSMGGNSSATRCIPNYIAMAENSVNANDGKVFKLTDQLSSPSGADIEVPREVHATTFRDGSLNINANITYQNSDTGGWTDTVDIPSSVIIVKGDVYINSSVQRIDAIIISSGTIYTCTNGPNNLMPTYPTCNTKLTINGAFIANSVKFWRTNGDVSAATPNEGDIPNIAEVFNFSPEIYVGQMPELFKRTTAKKNYDYITSLPPTL